MEFQVCAYYSVSLFFFGFGFFVSAVHLPAFLKHLKLNMPVWAIIMLMESTSFLLVIALRSPGRSTVVFLMAWLLVAATPTAWDPGPPWPSAGPGGMRCWHRDGLQAEACPCRSPLPGGEQGIGVLPSRGRGRATRLLCLLPLRASGGHWPCSCGLFCLPL